MSIIRTNWYRILALLTGPAAVLLAAGAAHANDVYPG